MPSTETLRQMSGFVITISENLIDVLALHHENQNFRCFDVPQPKCKLTASLNLGVKLQ